MSKTPWVLPVVPNAADLPWVRAPVQKLQEIGVPASVAVRWARERRTVTPRALARKARAARN